MSDPCKPASERARKRALGKMQRERSIGRQETYFDLLVSGYSIEQIATAMTKSPATVRRVVGLALAKRRLDPPEDYARIQVARLTKALRCADVSLEKGDVRAIAPFVKSCVNSISITASMLAWRALSPLRSGRSR
jgi:hypothetical protein